MCKALSYVLVCPRSQGWSRHGEEHQRSQGFESGCEQGPYLVQGLGGFL